MRILFIVIFILSYMNITAGKANFNEHDIGIIYSFSKENPEYLLEILATTPPSIPVRMCAEWEPAVSVLIRYPEGLPWSLISQFANDLHITCLVSNSSLSQAQSAFTNHGISLSNVDFVITRTNSYWTRDYGPWFVFDGNDTIGISDHIYNRPRPLDDQSNWALAPHLGVELWKTDLVHTGGNFMCDGHGIGMSSDLVYWENTYSVDSVNSLMNAYWGIHTYNTFSDPLLSSTIDHIDCYAKFLSETKIVVITNGYDDYNLNQVANTISGLTNSYGQNYEVVRLSCPSIHDAAYINSLILNGNIYVPITGNYDEDTAAIHFYEREMPGYIVQGFQDTTIYTGFMSTDAIHCRTKAIYDPGMLFVDHNPYIDMGTKRVNAYIKDYNGLGVKTDSVFFVWKFSTETSFNNYEVMNQVSGFQDSFYTYLPQPVIDDSLAIDYYIYAVDNSGRAETDPYTAPAGFYSIEYEVAAVEEELNDTQSSFSITRLNNEVTMSFSLDIGSIIKINIYDISGRNIMNITNSHHSSGNYSYTWNIKNSNNISEGIYFIVFETENEKITKKLSLVF